MSFETSAVPIQHYTGEQQLLSDITILRKPTVIRGCPFGPCSSWTQEHLAERLSGTSRPVHVTTETNMDFIAKNFRYATMDIGKVPLYNKDLNKKRKPKCIIESKITANKTNK